MRVFELARELNIPGKELISRMKDLGYKVEGNFNVLDDKTIAEVKKKLLQPVSRVEEQASPPEESEGEPAEQPRRRRIISARKSGEVRKIQESLGESGPLPEDQRTREAVQAEPQDADEPAAAAEAPAEGEAEQPRRRIVRRAKTEPEEGAEEAPAAAAPAESEPEAPAERAPAAAAEAPQSAPSGEAPAAVAAVPPEVVPPVTERPRAPRRVEGMPLPKPVEVEPETGRPPRSGGEEWRDVKRGRRGGEGDRGTGGWRDVRKDRRGGRGSGGDDEWVRARRPKGRRDRRPRQQGDEPRHTFRPRQRAIRIGGSITVSDLAGALGVKAADIIKKLMSMGTMVRINDTIDGSMAELIAADYDMEVQVQSTDLEELVAEEKVDPATLVSRPPIVTIMGHVDHGKTTLLDYIRSTRVASGEAGGITQHIGAYYVPSEAGDVVFLDTPGHEAFTALRQRGANVTDIVVLIVAADDGVMPQTKEAIDHARAAEVPIIVAMNKIDRPNAKPDKVNRELMEQGLVPEEFGGDTVVVPMSAKTGEGVEPLLEYIHLQAELLELKATREGQARGHVIESEMDRRRGPVATVIVERGVLKVGDFFVAGSTYGRVRALLNDRGENLDEAPPSYPVEVLGYDDLPAAGDLFVVMEDEKIAKQVAEQRAQKKKEIESGEKRRVHLEDFLQQGAPEEVRYLNLVLKADMQGSLEALRTSLEREGSDTVQVNIIRAGVGGITETDVSLAATSDAVVIGFNVRAEVKASELARNEGVDVKTYTVIYELINDVHDALQGMLKPIVREEVVGHAEVKDVFSVTKEGRIAGGVLTEGKLERNSLVRLYRDNVLLHSGSLNSLRRFKDDVSIVNAGQEFGFRVANFNDIQAGDVLEAVVRIEETPTLERASAH